MARDDTTIMTPYKGLVPYAEEDADYFFGRDKEGRSVNANLRASRLTLLFGDSGVGKTSLLNAGVVPSLRNDPAYSVIVFNTWQTDPVGGLREAMSKVVPGLRRAFEISPKSSFANVLTASANEWNAERRHALLVILDQFEEFFYYHTAPSRDVSGDDSFPAQLGELIGAADLPVHLLISIRGDALDLLYPLLSFIPTLFQNQLRIGDLTIAGARDAILKPLERFNEKHSELAIRLDEPREKVAGLVVAEIASGKSSVQAASLQLVMSQWWQVEVDAGSKVLRHETFVGMGGVHDIVANHLATTIDKLSEEDPEARRLIAALFDNRLVTPAGRKASRTLSELTAGIGYNEKRVSDLLEKLRAARILTVVGARQLRKDSRGQLFEFTHDLMATAAAQWFEKYDQAELRSGELHNLLKVLHSSADAVPDVEELDRTIESILYEVTEELKFEFATVSLVDEYRNCIETVRGRNVSPGWIMRARHPLNAEDIQTHIVKTGTTKTVVGWDDLLDKDIYERFEHWRLARVWVPIVSSDGTVVGTIEAGCNRERAGEILTDPAVERVKQLGCIEGVKIAKKRPHILLQGIARDAIRLIGADSATLHVYRRAASMSPEDFDWGELILAAGAGNADPEFVQSEQPRERGKGRKAIETGRVMWLDDPEQFKLEYPSLFDKGVRALAVVPLSLGSETQGVLGIHFWRSGKRFSPRERNLAEVFARGMDGVIRNYLMLRHATEAGSKALALSGLVGLMQSLNSPFSLPDVLKQISLNALLTLDADNAVVYQYHANDNSFLLPPVTAGQFITRIAARMTLRSDDILFELVKHGVSQFVPNVEQHPLLAGQSADSDRRFIDREKVKSCAVLVLRCTSGGEIVGLLLVNFRKFHEFSSEEKRAMDALATCAALAIRNARLHKQDLRRQLEAMHSVHAAIAEKGPDLKKVLECLLEQTLALTGAKYGVYMQWRELDKVLKPIARWPVREDYPEELLVLGQGIIGLAAQTRKSILVDDVEDSAGTMFVETVGEIRPAEIYRRVNPDARCEIAVPLLDRDQLLGVLNIEHPEPRALSHDDRVLLQTLSVPAIIALNTIDLYNRLDRRIRHQSALNLIASRVQAKPYDLDTILRLFLTGITAGGGLGFSRAMLFLADEGGHDLRGESAIGPVTRKQAEQVWLRFPPGEGTPSVDDLEVLLREAERFTDAIKEREICEYSPLTNAIRQLSFAIGPTAGAPGECLLTGKPVTVAHDKADPFRRLLDLVTEPDNTLYPFTAVPLVGKQIRQIGVLVVDNRFLWKEREIDAEDVAGLEAFAGVLALSIENVRLRQRAR